MKNINGQTFYLTDSGLDGPFRFAWTDEFNRAAVVNGQYSWPTKQEALAAAK